VARWALPTLQSKWSDMKQNQLFLPPRLNPVFTRLCQSISYLVAGSLYQISLKVEECDIEKIKSLGDRRIVYLPNHPTLDDGMALFMFSARLGQLFHYLVARDSFKGWLAYFLPLIGCYSMRRGVGDRTSIAQTMELLTQPAIRLVIFPEGGCSYQNDTVMPFRSGSISMAFQSLSKLAKQEKNLPPIYLVPLSLKYRYLNPMNSQIDHTLSRLEQSLNMRKISDNFYERLREVGEQVLIKIEQETGIKSPINDSNYNWNERINLLRNQLLEQCELKLNLPVNSQILSRERVYKIKATLEANLEQEENYNPEIEQFIKEATFQLLNFDAIYDGYVAENPVQERFLDTLNRLERSVFQLDKPSIKGSQEVRIKVGEPINLVDYYSSYKKNKIDTVEKLTKILQDIVSQNLKD
jgi:1-acyl-sn-glycerol-3-phosphate acyltransferase